MSAADSPSTLLGANRDKPAEDEQSLIAKGKRKLLGLAKKKETDKQDGDSTDAHPMASSSLAPSPPVTTPPAERRLTPRSSPRMHPASAGVSPNRRLNRSSSPGLHSPASSQIFERNVQESVSELSPAIPAHIQTEDHIPPVLEASSLAITDTHLNPDEVEIVMHTAHQPASAAVAGPNLSDSVYSSPSLGHEDVSMSSIPDLHDSLSNSTYASLDTTDVRRLSFISFADVVQAEHVENDRDAVQFMSLSSTANRSPSPVRSPTSSHGFSVSPPTSGGPGSPTTMTHGAHSPPLGGDLQIETMRQALRKTRSGDLSGARSQPLSALSLEEDGTTEQPPFR